MFRKRIARISASLMLTVAMLISASSMAMAKAPTIEEIEHNGGGRMEVEFYGKVKYKNCKVIVKDNYGKKYSVKNIKKDNDDIRFTIKKFKTGRTYKITVKGVRKTGTKKYGKATGSIKVKGSSSAKTITADKAAKTAWEHASKTWGTKDRFDLSTESDKYAGEAVWEVDFNGYEGKTVYEYEYKISKKGGKILSYDREIDD